MQFEVEIGDRLRTVAVAREGETFTVTVDGRIHVIDARRVVGNTMSMLVAAHEAAARSFEVSVVPTRERGAYDVHVGGHRFPVQVRAGGALGRRRGDAAHGAGPQRVLAPMPGKVVRVLVHAGDEVAPKQGLVVVEAMKMENELRASRAGRVREVAVGEGQSVEAGALLVVVE